MLHILKALCLCAFLLLLAACSGSSGQGEAHSVAPNPGNDPGAGAANPTTEGDAHSAALEETPNPGNESDGDDMAGEMANDTADEGLIFDLSFLIDIAWPEDTPYYRPDIELYPLTNVGRVYKTGVIGEITFVDRDLQTVSLPFAPNGFACVRSGTDVKGYTLYGAPGTFGAILMLTDGSIPLDKDGQYIYPVDLGHNGPDYETLRSAVITYRPTTPHGGEWAPPPYGVYDMKERRELLPCVYDAICIYDGLFCAMKDDRVWLLDSKCRELYAFDPTDDVIVWMVDLGEALSIPDYHLVGNQKIFYKHADLPSYAADSMKRWGAYYAFKLADASDDVFLVIDEDGREAYRSPYDNAYQVLGEHLAFWRGGAFVLLDSELREHCFPGTLIDSSFNLLHFDGRELFIRRGGFSDEPDTRFLALDENGNNREVSTAEAGQPPILYHYPGHYSLVDPHNSSTLLAGTSGYLYVYGDFIILGERDRMDGAYAMRTDPQAVYAKDGRLLLDNIYGYIDEAPGPGGGLFVYLDEETCVLLHLDGSTVPVPDAPVVESIYWGG